jgi:anti-sigma B factor antagonist
MSTKPFYAQVRNQNGATTIDLHGEINSFAEAGMNTAYSEAESSNPERVILNFTHVDYINSTGIALIVGLLARARKSRRQVVVFGLSSHYVEIFQITRLADFMTIYPDEASALSGA